MVGLTFYHSSKHTLMKLSELNKDEFNHFYATYLNMVKDETLSEALEKSADWFVEYTLGCSEKQLAFRYGDDKWTVAEVLLHIIDTERIFQYRAFRFSRKDATPLPGFDHNDYVKECEANTRTAEDIVTEFLAVRTSTIQLFKYMDTETLKYRGIASNMPWSVAALGFVISGHLKHHASILEERYV